MRLVDFKRDKHGIPATVAAIEYDPNRSARLALLHYADGEKRYIVAPLGLQVGDMVTAGPEADMRPGNSLPLTNIPLGTWSTTWSSSRARAASWCARREPRRSCWARKAPTPRCVCRRARCAGSCRPATPRSAKWATKTTANIKLGKAGRKRHLGVRPTVRGTAMSPRDHPHGGGEGRQPTGLPGPKSPWGKPTRGKRTRMAKPSDKYIVRRRSKKRR